MKQIKKIDKSNMRGSILSLGKQINHALNDPQFDLLKNVPMNITSVIIAGMGSSLISYKIIESLYSKHLTKPVLTINSSNLPKWANKNSLVILSSYSGNSIETLECAKAAIRQNCVIIAITTGGKLTDILKHKSHFIYTLNKSLYNPCAQPRMTLGFSYGVYLKILEKTKILKSSKRIIDSNIKSLESINIYSIEKKSKKYVTSMSDKNVYLISGGYLKGNTELFHKQLNWNAKQLSSFSPVPEAMHHITEAINHPRQKESILLMILTSKSLAKSDYLDLEIIHSYLKKEKIPHVKLNISSKNVVELAIRTLFLSSFISFYLSISYNQDPTPTPAIDFYKLSIKK